MAEPANRIVHIDFSDEDGLTIEVPNKEKPTEQNTQVIPRIPADLAPRAEHPLEKIAREKYEHRARAAFSRGLTIPTIKPREATWGEAIAMGLEWLFESRVWIAKCIEMVHHRCMT